MRRYLRAANVNWTGLYLHDVKEMDFMPAEQATYRLEPGDILLSEASGSPSEVGKPAIYRGELAPCFFQNTLIRVRPPEPLTRFLHLHFVKDALTGAFARASRGVGIHHLGAQVVEQWEVVVPPLDEQTRIVDAVDSYLSRIGSATTSLEIAKAKVKAYRASVLKAAVEGRLVPTEALLARTEGRSYEPAGALLERVLKERRRRWEKAELARMKAAGKTPKDDKWKSKYEEPTAPNTLDLPRLSDGWSWSTVHQLGEVTGGLTKNAARDSGPRRYPYLRVANVYANRLVLDDVKEIAVAHHELPRLLLRRGDLLVVEGNGSVGQIGRVALWDGSIEPAVHQNHLIKVRFVRGPLERWVLTWLLSPGGRAVIERVASSTSGLHTLSISKVQSLPVPLPPEREQARALEAVDRLSSIVDASADGIDASLRRCRRLRQSVLAWAFEGKLVDQDPADESAHVLLARIRAEREAETPTAPKAKRSRKLKAAS